MTWIHNTSPTCDLCNAYDIQDEQHVLFTAPIHTWSLCRTYVSLFPTTDFHNVSAILVQNNIKLFLPSCTHCFFMSRLEVALLD